MNIEFAGFNYKLVVGLFNSIIREPDNTSYATFRVKEKLSNTVIFESGTFYFDFQGQYEGTFSLPTTVSEGEYYIEILNPEGMNNVYTAVLTRLGYSYTLPSPISNNYRFGFNGQMKDDAISGAGNHNTALYWEYDSRLVRRWNLDPVRQAMISQYACFDGNPIWKSDVLGNKASDPSTHTDKDGNVIAVKDDGDNNVYRHKGDKEQATKDFNKNYSNANTSAGGKKMGQTLTPLSFADFGAYENDGTSKPAFGAKIDFNSNWATEQVNSILKAKPILPFYALNAAAGKVWDLKFHTPSKNGKNNPGYGSKLGNKYASARDAGNFAAGAVAQMSVIPNIITDYGYGTYNQSGNNAGVSILSVARDLLILDCIPIIGVYNVINTALTGEDKLSRAGQEAGKDFIINQNAK